jgi:hypothetical protein
MRVLGAVIELGVRPVFPTGEDLARRRAAALPRSGDNPAGPIGQALEKRAAALLSRRPVTPPLPENIEPMAVLIDGAPQIGPLLVDGEQRVVPVPVVPCSGSVAAELSRGGLPDWPAPIPEGFRGQANAPVGPQLFAVALAEADAAV